MKTVKNPLIVLLESLPGETGNVLCDLHDRWQCEKEYEDWADYEKVIVGLLENVRGFKMTKTTKRPIGIKGTYKGQSVHIFLKLTRTTASMTVRPIS